MIADRCYDLIDFARQALELNFSTQKNLFQQQATQNNASVTLNTLVWL